MTCNTVCALKWTSNVRLTSPNCRHWSIAVRDPLDNSASLTSWGMGRPESEGQTVGRGETKGEALTSCSLRRGPVGWVWRSWDGGHNKDTSLQQWGALSQANTPTGRHVLGDRDSVYSHHHWPTQTSNLWADHDHQLSLNLAVKNKVACFEWCKFSWSMIKSFFWCCDLEWV